MIKKRETALRAIENGKPKVNQWSEDLLWDSELCLAAIKAYSYSAWQIPSKYYINEDMCIEGVAAGIKLNRIPEPFRTETVCSIACRNNGTNIIDVPEEILTEEMCIDAVRNTPKVLGNIIKQTEKITLEAVNADGSVLCFANNKTLPICETAVKKNGKSIQFVPEEFLSAKMCFSAVTNDGTSIKFIPNRYITRSLCMTAVQNNCPLSLIPQEYHSDRLYLEYLKAGGSSHYLPQEKVIEAFEHLLSIKCNIIPTENERKEWKTHIYQTLVSIAEDDKEYMPEKDDSLEKLVNSLLLWAHENNGGYKTSGSRLCDWLSQEYESMYG